MGWRNINNILTLSLLISSIYGVIIYIWPIYMKDLSANPTNGKPDSYGLTPAPKEESKPGAFSVTLQEL